jgi:hypothetical protein
VTETGLDVLAGVLRSAWARGRIEATQGLVQQWEEQYSEDRQLGPIISTELSATHRNRVPKKEIDEARSQLLSDVATELKILRADIRTRANRSFTFLMVYASLAGAAILTATGLAIAGVIPAAAMSGIGGLLSGGAAAAFWKIYSIETRRADDLIEDLHHIEAARVSYLLMSDLPVSNRGAFTVEKLTRAPKAEPNL